MKKSISIHYLKSSDQVSDQASDRLVIDMQQDYNHDTKNIYFISLEKSTSNNHKLIIRYTQNSISEEDLPQRARQKVDYYTVHDVTLDELSDILTMLKNKGFIDDKTISTFITHYDDPVKEEDVLARLKEFYDNNKFEEADNLLKSAFSNYPNLGILCAQYLREKMQFKEAENICDKYHAQHNIYAKALEEKINIISQMLDCPELQNEERNYYRQLHMELHGMLSQQQNTPSLSARQSSFYNAFSHLFYEFCGIPFSHQNPQVLYGKNLQALYTVLQGQTSTIKMLENQTTKLKQENTRLRAKIEELSTVKKMGLYHSYKRFSSPK